MNTPSPDVRPDSRPDPHPDPRPVLLATGGTGGHMVPAAALAQELLKRGQPVALVTDRRGAGFGDRHGAALVAVPTLRIAAASPSGSPVRKLRALALLALGLVQSALQMLRLRPAAVVGFGGYASAPTVVAAALAGIPVVLHEQNAVLGRANRLLLRHGRLARRCWLALTMQPTEGSAAMPEARRCLTGNPVRAQVAMVRAMPYTPPTTDGPVRILVIGGSQGASIFADVVPAAIALLPAPLQGRLRIAQQCRAEDLDRVRAAYGTTAAQVELAPFIADVPRRLADVHLVISRSGASTVTELTAAGRPAILVPYPHAMDDHQSANARILGDAGAAFVMSASGAQASFTPDALSLLLEGLIGEPELLVGAARAAGELGIPDAAARLAALVALAIRDNAEKEHKK